MKILVSGLNSLTKRIASYFSNLQYDVVIVDIDKDKIKAMEESNEIKGFVASCTDLNFLKNIKNEKIGLYIASTASAEKNIISCQLIRLFTKAKLKIAMTYQHSFSDTSSIKLMEEYFQDVDVIYNWNSIISNYLFDISYVLEAKLSTKLATKNFFLSIICKKQDFLKYCTIKNYNVYFKDVSCKLVAIKRRKKLLFPLNREVISEGDELFFYVNHTDLKSFLKIFSFKKITKKILILGGGRIGSSLIDVFSCKKPSIKIDVIEKDYHTASKLAVMYPDCKILIQDGLNLKLLENLNFKEYDIIYSTTKDDFINSNFLRIANSRGANIISTIAKDEFLYNDFHESFRRVDQFDVYLSNITKELFKEKIISCFAFSELGFFLFEIEVNDGSLFENLSFHSFHNRYPNLHLVAIIRKDKTIFFDNIIESQDKIVLVSTKNKDKDFGGFESILVK